MEVSPYDIFAVLKLVMRGTRRLTFRASGNLEISVPVVGLTKKELKCDQLVLSWLRWSTVESEFWNPK